MLRLGGHYLAERHASVTLSHVGSLRAPGLPTPITPAHVLLVGDPDGTLPGARQEVEAVGARWPAAPRLLGQDATREAVLGNLGGKFTDASGLHGYEQSLDLCLPPLSVLVLRRDEARSASQVAASEAAA
jgi:hypothetical protein